MKKLIECFLISLVAALFWGCSATETSQVVQPKTVDAMGTVYSGPKKKVAVGKFDNRSTYMQGLFSDGVDRLGGQAKTILITHLQQSGRFSVLDRANMEEIAREVKFEGGTQEIKGAQLILTGQVTEFGRKVVGDQQLYGILGSSKEQVAYAKVSLSAVDVVTSDVVYSVQGAGEYTLSSREVVGFGGRSGYDSTLNGKVLDLAIREAVNRMVEGAESGNLK
ncbi:MAG: CsgG/HfaB family protein [Verrucomicrobiota bacterium]